MRIISLTENTQGSAGLGTEHGLCFYIETRHHKILMDTGQTDLFIRNAEKLGIDLRQVDTVVISHGHYDHGGGILEFARINPDAIIYIRESAFGDYYSLREDGTPRYIGLDPAVRDLPNLVLIREDAEDPIFRMDKELALFSGIGHERPLPAANSRLRVKKGPDLVQDDFCHEQCLVIRLGEERYLFSGCAHHGILNILDRYRMLFGGEPSGVFSGFHMMKKDGYTWEDMNQILDTALALNRTDTSYYTCHCTGTEPYELMKKLMGDKLAYIHTGDEILIREKREEAVLNRKQPVKRRSNIMKNHKFWAWATVTCFLMTMWTGYKRK